MYPTIGEKASIDAENKARRIDVHACIFSGGTPTLSLNAVGVTGTIRPYMKISVAEAKETTKVTNHFEDLSSTNLGRVAWSDDLNNPIVKEGIQVTIR
jgi:hypothetical protein